MFDPIVKEICSEYINTRNFARKEVIQTLLRFLMIKAERVKQTLTSLGKNTEQISRFSEFRQLLSGRYTNTRNADAYADMMHISYNHLNRTVKDVAGSTAKAFIDKFVILEARKYLAVSDISVKELSYKIRV